MRRWWHKGKPCSNQRVSLQKQFEIAHEPGERGPHTFRHSAHDHYPVEKQPEVERLRERADYKKSLRKGSHGVGSQ